MRPNTQLRRAAAALVFAGLGSVPVANAQLPNLSQLTETTAAATNTATAGGNTQTTATNANTQQTQTATTGTNTGNTNTNTGRTTATNTNTNTNTATTGGTSRSVATATMTGAFPSNPLSTSNTARTTATGTTTVAPGGGLSGAPTLAGVGIPTMIVPYTANAPFMKKSEYPEGTVFIAVGAVLAFLGICVIVWRAIVAWSVNRSVKRAAMASILAAETKSPGGWASNPFKTAPGGVYTQAPGGSTLSVGEHYGRPSDGPGPRGSTYFRGSSATNTGSGLFFSPTASAVNNNQQSIPMTGLSAQGGNRSSTYLPAGYYASPTAQIAGGANTTTLGSGPVPPFAQPTGPGGSPVLQGQRRSSLHRPLSNMQLAPPSRGGGEAMPRGGGGASGIRPVSGLNPQSSAGSLNAHYDHDGVRAPSAYLEDLFEGHHGNPGVMPPQPR